MLVATHAHVSAREIANLVSVTLLSMAIGTVLQILASGYFIANCPMPNYFAPALIAVQVGSLGLLAGMVMFSGLIQILIATVFKKLRVLFPAVLTGIIFCLIGLSMFVEVFKNILNTAHGLSDPTFQQAALCFLMTLSIIIILNIWGRGLLKLVCSGIGIILGAIIGIFFHQYPADKLTALHQLPWFALPHFHFLQYRFDYNLIILFLISGIASVMRASGAITTSQQINDANWYAADQNNLKKGLYADGISAFIAGLFGTMGIGGTPSSVGLGKSCGATSRSIGYTLAIILLVLTFCPKLGGLLLALPLSVLLGGLLYISCILFIGGIRVITAQEIDARKIFIVCLSIFFGLSTQLFPTFYQQVPAAIYPLVASVLTLGTIVAFVLNLIFRIGIRKTQHVTLDTQTGEAKPLIQEKLASFNLNSRQIENILTSVTHVVDLILETRANSTPITSTLSYDEIHLTVTLQYQGHPIALSDKKNFKGDDLEEENAFIEGIISLYKNFSAEKVECHVKDHSVSVKLLFAV